MAATSVAGRRDTEAAPAVADAGAAVRGHHSKKTCSRPNRSNVLNGKEIGSGLWSVQVVGKR